jgi:hypothetical protein
MFADRFLEVQASLGLKAGRLFRYEAQADRRVFLPRVHVCGGGADEPLNCSAPGPVQHGRRALPVRDEPARRGAKGISARLRSGRASPNPDGSFSLWPQGPFATSAELDDATLTDEIDGVSVHRHSDSSLSNTVIFPITEQQRNGLEDLRLVRFDHDDGRL